MSHEASSDQPLYRALQEASFRLAWYVRKYGRIPPQEQIRLAIAATGLQNDAEAVELLAEAREINEYFLKWCRE